MLCDSIPGGAPGPPATGLGPPICGGKGMFGGNPGIPLGGGGKGRPCGGEPAEPVGAGKGGMPFGGKGMPLGGGKGKGIPRPPAVELLVLGRGEWIGRNGRGGMPPGGAPGIPAKGGGGIPASRLLELPSSPIAVPCISYLGIRMAAA